MKLGTDRHTPQSPCTNCGKLLDGATSVGADAGPAPGDATVCIYCGHIMAFDAALKLRELTAEEIRKIAGDKRFLAIQRARHATAMKEKPRSFICPICGSVSYNPNDIVQRYCGRCHVFQKDNP